MYSDHQMPEASAARAGAAIVVVLYHPDADDLANLSRLADWGVHVVAVINAIGEASRPSVPVSGVQVIDNPRNLGLARALNQGLSLIHI